MATRRLSGDEAAVGDGDAVGVAGETGEPPGCVQVSESLEEEPAEQPREHAHGQEEAGPARDPAYAVRAEASAGRDDVGMGMVGHRRSPYVQHRGEADPGAEMPGIDGDGGECLGCGPEQQAVDLGLVLVGDGRDRRRQGEDEMGVGHEQQIEQVGSSMT